MQLRDKQLAEKHYQPGELLMNARLLTQAAILVSAILCLEVLSLPARGQEKIGTEEAVAIATDAYIYGYSLVTVEMTRRVTTNAVEPKGLQGPMGQFAN